jgi:hypothetical protein
MFSSQRRYYSEHAVFALHFHALFFLTGLVSMPFNMYNVPILDDIGFYWAILYCAHAIPRAFGKTSNARVAGFLAIYGVCAALAMIIAAEVIA